MKDYIKTILNGLLIYLKEKFDEYEIHTHSWNDLEDKPFGTKTEMVEIVPEQSVTKMSSNDGMHTYMSEEFIFDLVEGKQYKIVINGREHNVIGEYVTGPNIVMLVIPDVVTFANGIVAWSTSFGETITLVIYEEQGSVVQLDEKYIPFTIARTSYVDEAISNISIDVDTELSDTSENPVQNKVIKTELNNYLTKREMYIPIIDSVNGFTYFVTMINGQLVSQGKITSIDVTNMPDKTDYIIGEMLLTEGMVVTATFEDGFTQVIFNEEWNNIKVPENGHIDLTYTQFGVTYTTDLTVQTSSIELLLGDFEYTANEDGTYTLTAWKGTLNGEASTELVVPDSNLIQI